MLGVGVVVTFYLQWLFSACSNCCLFAAAFRIYRDDAKFSYHTIVSISKHNNLSKYGNTILVSL